MHLQTNAGSARLIRLIGDLAAVEVEVPRQDVAERLSPWLSAVDAVRLDGALHAIKALPPHRPAADGAARVRALDDELQRVRAALAKPLGLVVAASEYSAYQQRHAEHQRQMESQIASLRARARQALSGASPALRQLAALDAVMEPMLAAREHKLLSCLPVFLERRFEHLRQAHEQGGEAAQGAGWQDTFAQEWREVLLAELDLRLQPVVGMLEALGCEIRNHQ